MEDPKIIPLIDMERLYDRSRVTTDWKCQRMRYYQYEYDGKGIVSPNTALELFMGTVLHDGMTAIAKGLSINDIATAAYKQMYVSLAEGSDGEVIDIQYAREQATLVEGLLRGFYKHVWPKLIAEYPNVLMIEQELGLSHDGLRFMSKPDLVLGDNNGRVVYVEYKSTSSKREEWVNSWDTAVQLHSTIRAINQVLPEPVESVIVQGLYKGYESYGKQNSVFCYGYGRNAVPPFTSGEILYEYKSGYKKVPVVDMAGGSERWVENMPTEILAEQFPQTPPIMVNEYMLDRFFNQRASREQEIQLAGGLIKVAREEGNTDAVTRLLDMAFQQKFDQCKPFFGKPCQYRMLCFGQIEDPLKHGYIWREPHHAEEAERFKNEHQ